MVSSNQVAIRNCFKDAIDRLIKKSLYEECLFKWEREVSASNGINRVQDFDTSNYNFFNNNTSVMDIKSYKIEKQYIDVLIPREDLIERHLSDHIIRKIVYKINSSFINYPNIEYLSIFPDEVLDNFCKLKNKSDFVITGSNFFSILSKDLNQYFSFKDTNNILGVNCKFFNNICENEVYLFNDPKIILSELIISEDYRYGGILLKIGFYFLAKKIYSLVIKNFKELGDFKEIDKDLSCLIKKVFGDSVFGDDDIKNIDIISNDLNNILNDFQLDLGENIYPDIVISKLRDIVNRGK